MDLVKKLSQLGDFGHTIGNNTVLSFDRGAADSVLTFGRLGDEVVPEEHNIAQGGTMCIGETSLVSIRVYHQVILSRRAELKTHV